MLAGFPLLTIGALAEDLNQAKSERNTTKQAAAEAEAANAEANATKMRAEAVEAGAAEAVRRLVTDLEAAREMGGDVASDS